MRAPGDRLAGRYRLEERLGTGGMGEVWRATDEALGRVVAIKVMLPSLLEEPGFAERFRAEARAMASVDHPGVVTVHDFQGGGADGAFLVMEYVQGESLSAMLRRAGRLSVMFTLDLIAQAAEALQAAHERGIIHRDVKPANLLVRPGGRVVLTDFGIARTPAQTTLTTAGAVLGTPSYLSPEQVLGQPATARSDLYALGVVAYECLAGRRPFDRDNPFATAMARTRETPPRLPDDLPHAARAVVERALAVDPEPRWASAAEFAAACRHARAGPVPAAAPPLPHAPAPPQRPRRYALMGGLIAGGVVALLVIATGAVWAAASLLDDGGEPEQPTAAPPSATSTSGATNAGAGDCAWAPVEPETPELQDVGTPPPVTDPPEGTAVMAITTNRGEIGVEVAAGDVPCTYTSLVYLADQGFYDGTSCHRLVDDGIFVLQCGDPTGTNQGGPTYQFGEENLPRGQRPPYPRGTVAMAHAGPGTTGSQFFIVYEDSDIPPDYTVVGTVTSGLEIVEDVAAAGHDDAYSETGGGGVPDRELVIEILRLGGAGG